MKVLDLGDEVVLQVQDFHVSAGLAQDLDLFNILLVE